MLDEDIVDVEIVVDAILTLPTLIVGVVEAAGAIAGLTTGATTLLGVTAAGVTTGFTTV